MGIHISKLVGTEDQSEYIDQLQTTPVTTTFEGRVRYTQLGPRISRRRVHLYLGPNEVFFDKSEHLKTVAARVNLTQYGIAKPEWNQGKLYRQIDGLGRGRSDAMFWSFYAGPGRQLVKVYIKLKVLHAATLVVALDDREPIELPFTRSTNTPLEGGEGGEDSEGAVYTAQTHFCRLAQGFHSVRVGIIQSSKPGHSVGSLEYIKLSSKRLLAVVRERFRPAATHIGFRASSAPNFRTTHLIMGIQQMSKHGCFAPISTTFGYCGPIFKSADRNPTGINFSMWSFGKKQASNPPPRSQWSRLVALGPKGYQFGEFTNESTGVKPLTNGVSIFGDIDPPYVISLQCTSNEQENGGFVTTYTSHYWSGDKWKLYAAGQKFSERPVLNLAPRSFLEVTGVPEKQRTNHVPRVVQYEGFVATTDQLPLGTVAKQWHPLDQIVQPADKLYDPFVARHTNKRWSTTDTHLWASCGGLNQRRTTQSIIVHSCPFQKPPSQWPAYMQKVHQLDVPLPYPSLVRQERASDNHVYLTLNLPDRGNINLIRIYYGMLDGLTITRLWPNYKWYANVRASAFKLPAKVGTQFRILVERKDGQYWSLDTYTAR